MQTEAVPRINGQMNSYLQGVLSDIQLVVGANRIITWQLPDRLAA
jgi:hypothetical protein